MEGTILCQTVKEKDLEVTTNQQMGQACNAHQQTKPIRSIT